LQASGVSSNGIKPRPGTKSAMATIAGALILKPVL
jgi:hypothetical protein